MSELMQRNANAIKTMAEQIESLTQPAFFRIVLDLPKSPFFQTISALHDHLQDNPEIVEKGEAPPPITPSSPIAVERKELRVMNSNGEVIFMVGKESNITSIDEMNRVYCAITGQPTELLMAPSTQENRNEVTVTIKNLEKDSVVINAGVLGSSAPIGTKNNSWFAAFKAYIENNYTMDKKHVLKEFNLARSRKNVNNNDVKKVSQVHYQIIRGLERSFPALAPLVSFEKLTSTYNKGRIRMKVDLSSHSTLLS
jgi:hypothetical protein